MQEKETTPTGSPVTFSGAIIRSYAEQGIVPPRIGIISLDSGNIRSVANALSILGAEVREIRTPKESAGLNGAMIPGVGAFPAAMRNLKRNGLDKALAELARQGLPLFGICLGMQLLTNSSDEFEPTPGLGLVPGQTRTMKAAQLPLPHVGWNRIRIAQGVPMYSGIPDNTHFYFDHSYAVSCDRTVISARADYGGSFVASVCSSNIWGTQFHPEKSQLWGLKLLRNFLDFTIDARGAC
ncbi:imidazole glycerol phosphate synthase subunit HisH [Pseudodesulfovibrio tunisiensis]|uniref:imidazole glycerol phosphate synthase subunit HisH n=1 Tax=Pseudodesulfovibrio tunisiensis TaxID=463192 RepID=UPI001FB3679B|nr:imidazole glycerol phosphate synthase subunit HisH [Pseudodesulfovibrio tunisiensis]